MATQRERSKRKLADASKRSAIVGGGERAYLTGLPVPLFEVKAGVYELDVIPYVLTKNAKKFKHNIAMTGDTYYERMFHVHRNIGPNQETHICLANTYGQPCPSCEELAKVRSDPRMRNTQEGKDAYNRLKTSLRQILLIRDLAKKGDKSREIELLDTSNFAFGAQLDEKIKNAREAVKESYKTFYDPDGGYTLRVAWKETPMNESGGTYLKATIDELIARPKGLPEALIDHGFDLDTFLNPLDYKAYAKLFYMGGAADDQDDDESGESSGRSDRGTRARDNSDADEDEDNATSRRSRVSDDDDDSDGNGDEREFKEGDRVKFEYRGKTYTGTVDEAFPKKQLAYVIDDKDPDGKPKNVDFGDLEILEEEAPKRRRRSEPEDEDDDDKPTRRRRSEPEDEDDDDKPARRRRSEPEDEDEDDKPTRRRRSRSDDDGDDDEPSPRRRGQKSRGDEDEEQDSEDDEVSRKPTRRGKSSQGKSTSDDDDESFEDKPRRTRR